MAETDSVHLPVSVFAGSLDPCLPACLYLMDGWFQDKANQRKQDLEDSLQAQQYFADANEAETWMREKEPIAANTDYGRDEDSAEVRFRGLGLPV